MTVETITSIDEVSQAVTDRLATALKAGQSVLWLMAGGSAIKVAVAASHALSERVTDLTRLTVGLTDERYGEVGFADSNWRQLTDQGFSVTGATLHPMLAGNDLETTTHDQAAWLKQELGAHDLHFGLFGIGPDGHTGGMLPGSPAVGSQEYAYGYESDPFTRITITPPAIARLDEVMVYAVGDEKRPVLKQLVESSLPLDEQPAQALKTVPIVTVYTDQKEL